MNISFKTLILTISLSINMSSFAVVEGENGIETQRVGRYPHTYIKADSPLFEDNNPEKILKTLKEFVAKCKTQEPNNAVYFQLPDEKSQHIGLLRKAGFQYDSDWYNTISMPEGAEERIAVGQVWIIRNKSSVPAQPSFTHTGRMTYIDKNGYVLLVKKGPTKTFPGGISNAGEDPLGTALREFEEEVGVKDINKKSIVPLGVLHRTPKTDSLGLIAAGDTSFYYACVVDSKENIALTKQESEISWMGWLHWKEILQSEEVGSHIKLMVEKMVSGSENDETLTHELPDFHTLYRSPGREENAKIWNPSMFITLPRTKPLI